MSAQIRLTTILIACCVALILTAILWPFLRPSRYNHRFPCLANVKQLTVCQLIYCDDFDDRFPQAESWMEDAAPYYNGREFFCPTLPDRKSTQFGYAMYFKVASRKVDSFAEPDKTISLFESVVLDMNATTSLVGFGDRHQSVPVSFVDGHVKVYGPYNSSELQKSLRYNRSLK